MNTRHRWKLVWVMGVLAGSALGCDWTQVLGDPDAPAPPSTHQPDAAAPMDGSTGTEAMCRHYCQALEETDLLVCASSGTTADADACEASTPKADLCVALRCSTGRVDTSLCLTQCDALARYYDAHCPVAGPSPDPLCPTSRAEHDRNCRAGCVL